jgi:hypothetical protein
MPKKQASLSSTPATVIVRAIISLDIAAEHAIIASPYAYFCIAQFAFGSTWQP